MNKKALVLIALMALLLLSGCTVRSYDLVVEEECKEDCQKLGLEMLRSNYNVGGLFGPTSRGCWCKAGSESKRIW